MKNRSVKNLFSKQNFLFLILTVFLVSAFTASAQNKRRTQPISTGKTVKKSGSKPEESKLTPVDPGKRMGDAYRSGVLPEQATVPAGTVEMQAAFLAEAVSRRDENSTAALLAALKAAGYGIRQTDGSVDHERSGWQGMVFDAWQVAAIARSYGNGVGIGLGKFGDGLELIFPEWKKETNADDIVRSVRAAMQSEHAPLRFWAHFIVELGRKTDAPYDLLKDADIKHARLNVVQLTLIMTRLAADLNFAVKRQSPNTTNAQLDVPSFSNAGRGPRIDENLADDAPTPCTTSEMENLILDLNATGMGIGFGQFNGYLEDKGVVSSKPAAVLGGANALLIALKFFTTYAALDSEIVMNGDQMLTRTKTTQDGERKTLTAKVKIDLGRWQAMNCIRPALNAAGLDFSVPTNGALAGTRIDWNLIEGGASDSSTGRVLHTIKNIPSILIDGTMEPGDEIVFLDTQAGIKNDNKRHYNYTDANGESKIDAVGVRQSRDMSRDKLRPVMKRMSVALDIQIKTMRLTDKTAAAGTANDLAGNVMAFFTKDIPGFIYGTTAETLYRSNLGSSKIVTIPVKDWMLCDGGWSGTVTRTTKFRKDEPNVVNGTKSSSGYKEWTETLKLNVTGKENKIDGILKNGYLAAGKIKFDEYIFHKENDQKFQCTTTGGSGKTRSMRWGKRDYTDKHFNKADHDADTTVYVMTYDDYALLDVSIPEIIGDSFYDEKLETPCPEADRNGTRSGQESYPYERNTEDITDLRIPYNPKNPGVLQGTTTINNPDGSTSVLTWDLARCLN